jgi:hypothetical protein
VLSLVRSSFGGIEHGRVGVGPQNLLVLGDDGSSDHFVLQVNVVLVVLVDHRLEKFADVVGVQG